MAKQRERTSEKLTDEIEGAMKKFSSLRTGKRCCDKLYVSCTAVGVFCCKQRLSLWPHWHKAPLCRQRASPVSILDYLPDITTKGPYSPLLWGLFSVHSKRFH